jgi:hypothetical protein
VHRPVVRRPATIRQRAEDRYRRRVDAWFGRQRGDRRRDCVMDMKKRSDGVAFANDCCLTLAHLFLNGVPEHGCFASASCLAEASR